MNEYNIDLHDSKGRESRVITGEFGSNEDIAKTLLQAIQTAKHYGYCRVTLDIALDNRLDFGPVAQAIRDDDIGAAYAALDRLEKLLQ